MSNDSCVALADFTNIALLPAELWLVFGTDTGQLLVGPRDDKVSLGEAADLRVGVASADKEPAIDTTNSTSEKEVRVC